MRQAKEVSMESWRVIKWRARMLRMRALLEVSASLYKAGTFFYIFGVRLQTRSSRMLTGMMERF